MWSPRPNGPKIRAKASSAMPTPWSTTRSSVSPAGESRAATVIFLPSGENFTALVSRLSNTCLKARSSA
jgi:hypothetical protein